LGHCDESATQAYYSISPRELLELISRKRKRFVTAAVSLLLLLSSLLVLSSSSSSEREEDGSWRKLHNDELHSLYSSPNIIMVIKSRRMRWAGHVARMVEGRGVYRVLVGRPEGKRPLGRLRRRWEDNIKLDLRKIVIDGANGGLL
jgi:hypothetical protein